MLTLSFMWSYAREQIFMPWRVAVNSSHSLAISAYSSFEMFAVFDLFINWLKSCFSCSFNFSIVWARLFLHFCKSAWVMLSDKIFKSVCLLRLLLRLIESWIWLIWSNSWAQTCRHFIVLSRFSLINLASNSSDSDFVIFSLMMYWSLSLILSRWSSRFALTVLRRLL